MNKKQNKMVITPKQVKETPGMQDRAQFKELEQAIDGALRDGNMVVTVVGGVNPRVKDRVLQRYQEAGWQVQYVADQRANVFYFQEQRRPIGFQYNGN